MGGAIASGARNWRNLLLSEKGIVWSCAVFATEKSSLECSRTDRTPRSRSSYVTWSLRLSSCVRPNVSSSSRIAFSYQPDSAC